MKRFWFLVMALRLIQSLSANDGYPRNMKIDILHYGFAVAINDSTSGIEGKTRIKVKFLDICDSFAFDLKKSDSNGYGMNVTGISMNSLALKWKHVNDRLLINLPNSTKANDTLEFLIHYSGVPADGLIISRNKFGNRTFFADHWPDRAHNYLPCIDHPYDKATVDFIITAPDKYMVIASGILVEESDWQGPLTLTHWSESVPIATKVMTFGAAQFAVQLAGVVDKIPVWSWVLHMLRNKIGNDAFMNGLQLYYKRFHNSNALTSDFISIMEEVSGTNLNSFFKQWLYTGGQPDLGISHKVFKKNGTAEVTIVQKQEYLFEFDLELFIRDNSGEKVEKITVKEKMTKVIVPVSGNFEIIPDPHVKLLFK